VPLSRSRGEAFDDLVLDAVEQLEQSWPSEVSALEFAVEDVPTVSRTGGYLGGALGTSEEFDPYAVLDRGVALGRLFPDGAEGVPGPLIVVYRRPLEARAVDREDRGDLVFAVVVELVAQALNIDVDELDPPHD
jgi:hypothetical protein